MICTALVLASMAAVGIAVGFPFVGDTQSILSESHFSASDVCQQIADSVSSASAVYYDGSSNYQQDTNHWATSSSQLAACSFEPGTAGDVGIALQILGRTKTNFAVRIVLFLNGSHGSEWSYSGQGWWSYCEPFSSTPGVQIAMSRFSDVVYDSATQTATIGAGLVWDDVYAALEPHGVNVVGGRVSGVGVAGFTLGGGYSWLTNQYGLTIDTVQVFELVMPNGTAINVTESNPDLFFALKGGLNNFGIVTRFTLKTFPQTHVWGGFMTYGSSHLDLVNQATANFAANITDPKAAIIVSYNSVDILGANVILMVFYDAQVQPADVFDEFLALPWVTKDISVQSFSSFVKSIPSKITDGERAVFNSISVPNIPVSFLGAIVSQTNYWWKHLPFDAFFISYDVEPFLPTLFNHNTTSSAYPPDRTQPLLPLNIYYAWLFPTSDQAIWEAIRESAKTLSGHVAQIERDGGREVADPIVYPNYAIFDTPLVDVYGANLPRLQAIKAVVDPENVMGLAGGFKI